MTDFLAADIGAESGRVVAGRFADDRIDLHVLHRFPTGPVVLPDGLRVDVVGAHRGILEGIRRAADAGFRPASLGIDTWGVSFALLDADGALLGLPVHYRDPGLAGRSAAAHAAVSSADLFAATGAQDLPFNTSVVLHGMRHASWFSAADRLLMLPDLLAYWLTGRATVERTNASTTQLFDPETNDWAWPVVDRLGLPQRLFRSPLVSPGAPVGPLRPGLDGSADRAPDLSVVAVGSHDTASAVAAVPAEGTRWGYISSGTWSLVGVERPAPLKTPEARAARLANEVGVGGRIRLLRNVMGLWLIQECRRWWEAEGDPVDYETLSREAAAAPALAAWFDPDHPLLFPPGDMPARIRRLAREAGFPEPDSRGAVVRAAVDSLALKYRYVIDLIASVAGEPVDTVHVVGGGARNAVLCQATADACDRPVVAGPVEATALGNLLVQAEAAGLVDGLDGIRDVVRRSFAVERYEPAADRRRWDDAFAGFADLIASTPRTA